MSCSLHVTPRLGHPNYLHERQFFIVENILTWQHILRLRNLVMMKIILNQAPRAGVLTNATLGDFLKRKRTVEPDSVEEVSTFQVTAG